MSESFGVVLAATWIESAGVFLTILTPLVAVPLTVITFYLRSLREHQVSWHADLIRRVESLELSTTELRRVLADFERDYTSKEEWLRECTLARGTFEQLKESTIRMETRMQDRYVGMVPTERVRCTSSVETARDEGI